MVDKLCPSLMVASSRPCRLLPRKLSLFSSCLPLSTFFQTTAKSRTFSGRATNVLARSRNTTTTTTKTTTTTNHRSTRKRNFCFLCYTPLKLGRLSHHELQQQQQQRRLFSSNVATATKHSQDDRNAIDVDNILSLRNLPLYQYVRKLLRSKSLPETQVIDDQIINFNHMHPCAET